MADSLLFTASGGPDLYEYTMGNYAGTGAFTQAVIFKTSAATLGGGTGFLMGQNESPGSGAAFGIEGSAGSVHLVYWDGTNAQAHATNITVADEWFFGAVTKAAGTAIPRFHLYRYSTATWSHGDAGGTSPNQTAVQPLILGSSPSAEGYTGNILIAGLWDAALTDTQIECLISGKPAWLGADEAYRLDNTTPVRIVGTSTLGTNNPAVLDTGDVPSQWSDTWGVVSTHASTGSQPALTLTGVNNGDLILLFGDGGSFSENHFGNGKPTDDKGNTYTQIGFHESYNSQSIEVFMTVHAGTDNATVVITPSSYSSFGNHVAMAYRNFNSPSSSTNPPVLMGTVQDSVTNVGAGTDAITIGGSKTVTTYGSNAKLVAICLEDNTTPTITAGTNFLMDKILDGSTLMRVESREVPAGSYGATFTTSGTHSGGMSLFAFGMKADLPNYSSQQFSIPTDSDDGGGYKTATSWGAPMASGTFADQDLENNTYAFVSASFTSPDYFADNIFTRFDTGSVIPSGATILWARLILYAISYSAAGQLVSIGGRYYDYGGAPPVSADWYSASLATGSDLYLTNSIFCRLYHAYWMASGGANGLIAAHLHDLSGIKRAGEVNAQGFTGYTGINIFSDTGGATPTVFGEIKVAMREHTTVQEPRLEVGWYSTSVAPDDIEIRNDQLIGRGGAFGPY